MANGRENTTIQTMNKQRWYSQSFRVPSISAMKRHQYISPLEWSIWPSQLFYPPFIDMPRDDHILPSWKTGLGSWKQRVFSKSCAIQTLYHESLSIGKEQLKSIFVTLTDNRFPQTLQRLIEEVMYCNMYPRRPNMMSGRLMKCVVNDDSNLTWKPTSTSLRPERCPSQPEPGAVPTKRLQDFESSSPHLTEDRRILLVGTPN